jgi:NAD(P)-dependent dehydrogenase (short-subunit alcohol dehydrogenase family)
LRLDGSSSVSSIRRKRFVAEGARVIIIGRRQAELDQAVRAIGAEVTAVQGDVSNLADLDRLFSKVRSEHGRIDILFATAGLGALEPLGKITEAAFDLVFGEQGGDPQSRPQLGARPERRWNSGQRAFPGPTSTPGVEGLKAHLASIGQKDAVESVIPATTLGRIGRPEEVAVVGVVLASDDSSFMTGSEVFVDSGVVQV